MIFTDQIHILSVVFSAVGKKKSYGGFGKPYLGFFFHVATRHPEVSQGGRRVWPRGGPRISFFGRGESGTVIFTIYGWGTVEDNIVPAHCVGKPYFLFGCKRAGSTRGRRVISAGC